MRGRRWARGLAAWLCGMYALFPMGACVGTALAMTVSVTYEASDAVLENPYIGNVVWASSDKEREQPFSMVYADVTWAELEPEKGVFDFETFEAENHFEYWREQGKHAVLRFVIDKPSTKKHMDIPEWLYEATGGDGEYYKIDYGRGYNPNYANEVFIRAHARVIRALGERYGADPFIAFVELGSLGHWGEWHVSAQLAPLPATEIRERYVQPYVDAFPNALLMMRRPFTHADTYGLGIFNDSAGKADSTEEWLSWIEEGGTYSQTGEANALVPMAEAWRSAPIGGELSSSLKIEKLLGDGLEQTLSLFERSHTSWVGPGSFVDLERDGKFQSDLNTLLNTLGYRLRVERLDVSELSGDRIALYLTMQNDGIAPFYFDWQPSLRITASDGTQSIFALEGALIDVQPDVAYVLSKTLSQGELPKGEFTVSVGIVNPATGLPGAALAMEAPESDLWYDLVRMTVR